MCFDLMMFIKQICFMYQLSQKKKLNVLIFVNLICFMCSVLLKCLMSLVHLTIVVYKICLDQLFFLLSSFLIMDIHLCKNHQYLNLMEQKFYFYNIHKQQKSQQLEQEFNQSLYLILLKQYLIFIYDSQITHHNFLSFQLEHEYHNI